jgi:hypothetical protein
MVPPCPLSGEGELYKGGFQRDSEVDLIIVMQRQTLHARAGLTSHFLFPKKFSQAILSSKPAFSASHFQPLPHAKYLAVLHAAFPA